MVGLLELRTRKVQFILIAVVVALIAYLVLMVNGLGAGLNDRAGSALRNMDADALAYPEAAGLSLPRAELSQEVAGSIEGLPGVEESALLGYVSGTYRDADGAIESAAFIGVDPGSVAEPEVTDGDQLSPDDETAILADRIFLAESGYEVGDTLSMTFRLEEREFTIAGEVDDGSFFFQSPVYMPRTTWQELRYGSAEEGQPVGSVMLLKGNDLAGQAGEGYQVVSKDTAFANIEGVSGQQATITALQFFGYIIGALVVGVFFYVLTLQKVPQMGVLKAIGAGNGYVFRQLMIQVAVVASVGVAVALLLAWGTLRALGDDAVLPLTLSTDTYVTTAAAMLATAVVGASLSAWQLLRIDPIIALGYQQ